VRQLPSGLPPVTGRLRYGRIIPGLSHDPAMIYRRATSDPDQARVATANRPEEASRLQVGGASQAGNARAARGGCGGPCSSATVRYLGCAIRASS
jgi:hypothetical protein